MTRRQTPDLAARRQQVLQLALAGQTARGIAAALGVPLRTIQRDLETLRPELEAARAEQLQAVRAALAEQAADAVRVLAAVAADRTVPPSVQVQAATQILAMLARYHQVSEQDRKLVELEERLLRLERRRRWTSIGSSGGSNGSRASPALAAGRG